MTSQVQHESSPTLNPKAFRGSFTAAADRTPNGTVHEAVHGKANGHTKANGRGKANGSGHGKGNGKANGNGRSTSHGKANGQGNAMNGSVRRRPEPAPAYCHVVAVHEKPRTSCLSHDSVAAPSFLGFRNLLVLVVGTLLNAWPKTRSRHPSSSPLRADPAGTVVMNLRLVVENFIKVCMLQRTGMSLD